MSQDVLLRQDRDGVRLLTLNRPAALNAFNDALYLALADALLAASGDESVACVVLTAPSPPARILASWPMRAATPSARRTASARSSRRWRVSTSRWSAPSTASASASG